MNSIPVDISKQAAELAKVKPGETCVVYVRMEPQPPIGSQKFVPDGDGLRFAVFLAGDERPSGYYLCPLPVGSEVWGREPWGVDCLAGCGDAHCITLHHCDCLMYLADLVHPVAIASWESHARSVSEMPKWASRFRATVLSVEPVKREEWEWALKVVKK